MKYVLLTAAKNEAELIEIPLNAVTRQKVPPVRWVIVSDASSDATDSIVKRFASRHDFIELARLESVGDRKFSRKAVALRAAYERVQSLSFDYVGNLDADISMAPDYYASAISEFGRSPRIGIVTGRRHERSGKGFVPLPPAAITGAIQLFRRECWEMVDGYLPLRHGGEDTAATILARLRGWELACLPHSAVYHHRPSGSVQGGPVRRGLQNGAQAWDMGYHPLFYISMAIRDGCRDRALLTAAASIAGYAVGAFSVQERGVSDDFVRFIRKEQLQKLKRLLQHPDSRSALTTHPVE